MKLADMKKVLTTSHPTACLSGYMVGRGGRLDNNKIPKIFTPAGLRQHVGVMPLGIIMAAGTAFVSWYIVRLASRSPDVNWSRREMIWNDWAGKQFKLYNPSGIDYSKEGLTRPDIPELRPNWMKKE